MTFLSQKALEPGRWTRRARQIDAPTAVNLTLKRHRSVALVAAGRLQVHTDAVCGSSFRIRTGT